MKQVTSRKVNSLKVYYKMMRKKMADINQVIKEVRKEIALCLDSTLNYNAENFDENYWNRLSKYAFLKIDKLL